MRDIVLYGRIKNRISGFARIYNIKYSVFRFPQMQSLRKHQKILLVSGKWKQRLRIASEDYSVCGSFNISTVCNLQIHCLDFPFRWIELNVVFGVSRRFEVGTTSRGYQEYEYDVLVDGASVRHTTD